MTIEEFKSILNNKSMQQKQTNIKLVEDKTTNGGKLTLAKFYKEFTQFVAEQRKFNIETNKKFEYIFDVFKRNNLK